MLESALQQVEAWVDQALDLPVGVNMSAYQLQQPVFFDKLKARMNARPKGAVIIWSWEVLETTALDEIDAVANVICACAAMGIGFAWDDFGTGYSSFSRDATPAHQGAENRPVLCARYVRRP